MTDYPVRPAIPETADEAVARGVAVLDQVRDDDWRSLIDLEDFNIASFNTCVLGQLYGDFGSGVEALFGPDCPSNIAGAHGFDLTRNYGTAGLQQEWLEELSH